MPEITPGARPHGLKAPNAYGATLDAVERLSHPKSLVWRQVTWTTDDGRTWTAKTLPGGSVNHIVDTIQIGAKVNVLTNGRGQVIWTSCP